MAFLTTFTGWMRKESLCCSQRETYVHPENMFGDKMDKLVVIGDNGVAISNCGEIIYKSLMDVEEYQKMIRFVEDETDGVAVLCALSGAYVLKKYEKYAKFFRGSWSNLTFVDDMRSLDVEANKFTIFAPDGDAAVKYKEIYTPRFGDNFSVTVGGREWIDIMNKGLTRAWLCERSENSLMLIPVR